MVSGFESLTDSDNGVSDDNKSGTLRGNNKKKDAEFDIHGNGVDVNQVKDAWNGE